MRKIECIIPNGRYAVLEKSLRQVGISGITVSEVKGFGNEQTRPEAYLLLPKTKIELYANDDDVNKILDVIENICRTGSLGDGKVFISAVEDVVRIRTWERGVTAV